MFKNVTAPYHELVIYKKSPNDDVFDINIPENIFNKLFIEMKAFSHKCFQKTYKTYRFEDLFYENSENKEVKIYKKRINNITTHPNFLEIAFDKEKLPYHAFPCTASLHDEYWVKRASYRLHNRLFVNFELQKYPDETLIRKIFINYNHDSNVDTEHINAFLYPIVRKFNKILEESIF